MDRALHAEVLSDADVVLRQHFSARGAIPSSEGGVFAARRRSPAILSLIVAVVDVRAHGCVTAVPERYLKDKLSVERHISSNKRKGDSYR